MHAFTRLPAPFLSKPPGHFGEWSEFLPSPEPLASLFRHVVRESSLHPLRYLRKAANRPCSKASPWILRRAAPSSISLERQRSHGRPLSEYLHPLPHIPIPIRTCKINESPILTPAAPTLPLSTFSSSTWTESQA
jgi:hypothetical protein